MSDAPAGPGLSRSRVLLAVPDTRLRLRLVAALRGAYQLRSLDRGQDPLRAIRGQHPDLVLLAVPRARSSATLQACRAIKTDAGSPPLVALIDPDARLSHPDSALLASAADGYLGQDLDPADLLAFVVQVFDGQRPVSVSDRPPRGLLARLFRGGS